MQLLENGSVECLSQYDTAGRTIYVKTVRGKSLSPPKIASNRKQIINSNVQFNRSLTQRHIVRPLNILRKQRLLSKARQQAKISPRHNPTTMGKSIPKEIIIKPSEQPDEKAHSSDESEYSSLEDDDDVQGNFPLRPHTYSLR